MNHKTGRPFVVVVDNGIDGAMLFGRDWFYRYEYNWNIDTEKPTALAHRIEKLRVKWALKKFGVKPEQTQKHSGVRFGPTGRRAWIRDLKDFGR